MSKREDFIFSDERRIKKELNELRNYVRSSHDLKEKEFRKLRELQGEIKKLSEESKNLKSENDKSNLNFFELRNERNKYNKEVRMLISEIKILREQSKGYGDGRDVGNPENILREIEDLELKIETEGYSFEKEQKVMEKIKSLKRRYEENKELFEMSSEIRELSKKIDDAMSKADELHMKFLELKEKNQAEYERFFSIIKNLNELRKKERSIFEEYKKHKANYTANLGLFNNKKRELEKAIKSVENVKAKKHELRLIKEKNIINKKAAIVEEKIKKGLKLTREDIMVLQGADDVAK